MLDLSGSRPILVAEVMSVGAEITVGETRDTNGPEIAGELARRGVRVVGIHALPDELSLVSEAFIAAAFRADLIVSTGGLGPTPDDLTREAIAAACGEEPSLDPDLERWLRGLWDRRGMAFPEINLKQAWLIPSATAIPNANGTAPGWWVERADGRLIVALPGPPREMRPMLHEWVLPRLEARGLGRGQVIRTLRLFGIGESQVADLLGDGLLRGTNPVVATYARADAVDIRIAAVDGLDGSKAADGGPDGLLAAGGAPADLADDAERRILAAVGEHVWGRDRDTWPEAIDRALAERGWTLAIVEAGTGGALVGLLGSLDRLRRAELVAAADIDDPAHLATVAERARSTAGADVGLAVRAAERGDDTGVTVSIATPDGNHTERRLAFLRGDMGRARAALTAASVLLARLRSGVAGPVEAAR